MILKLYINFQLPGCAVQAPEAYVFSNSFTEHSINISYRISPDKSSQSLKIFEEEVIEIPVSPLTEESAYTALLNYFKTATSFDCELIS